MVMSPAEGEAEAVVSIERALMLNGVALVKEYSPGGNDNESEV